MVDAPGKYELCSDIHFLQAKGNDVADIHKKINIKGKPGKVK